jgi:putative acetyltransferase
MQISVDNLSGDDVKKLLQEHLDDMYAISPAESVHALDIDALKKSDVTFWSARNQHVLLGCAALKELDEYHAELKSMRIASSTRKQGVASALLEHVIYIAKQRGYHRISLETGTMDFFKPAQRLYLKYDFVLTGPFGQYQDDPNSVFMTLVL